jgi:hypothetical protein
MAIFFRAFGWIVMATRVSVMPFTINWDDEARRILYLQLKGRWHWGDLSQALSQAYQMIDDNQSYAPRLAVRPSQRVDLILDLRESQMTMPRGVPNHLPAPHQDLGATLFIGNTATYRTFWTGLLRLYHRRGGTNGLLFAPTLEAARQTLLGDSQPH